VKATLLALMLVATTAQARKPTGAKPMGDAIVAICEYLMDKPLNARAVATKLGMHLHDEIVDITFTPRDRRFAKGSAVREPDAQELGLLKLKLAPDVKLSFAEVRATLGELTRLYEDHNPPAWEAEIKRADKPMTCSVRIELRGDPEEATDAAEVRSITFNPGPKL
jgi:hypothetical protein